MKLFKLTMAMIGLGFSVGATAQGGNDPSSNRNTAEDYAFLDVISAKYDLGLEFLKDGRYGDALQSIREGIALETSLGSPAQDGHQ